jgi:hypothetical protein
MNLQWVKIDSWHVAESTATDGNTWTVHTRCGLIRPWDGVVIDRLPGGGEKSCELCLRIVVRASDEPEPAAEPEEEPAAAAPAPAPGTTRPRRTRKKA